MTDPSGVISLAKKHLADSLANSASFQAWVNHSGDATSAAEHIYWDALPRPSDNVAVHTLAQLKLLRPFAIISLLRTQSTARSGGGTYTFGGSGGLMLEFEQDILPAIKNDPKEIVIQFENSVGAIMADLQSRQHTGLPRRSRLGVRRELPQRRRLRRRHRRHHWRERGDRLGEGRVV